MSLQFFALILINNENKTLEITKHESMASNIAVKIVIPPLEKDR